MKTYQVIARAIGAKARCIANGNHEWETKHQERIDSMLESFPSGSGFDSGTTLDDSSTAERLVFNTSYHHMNEAGCYDGWTEHQVIVTPSLELEYTVRITGKDRNCIKDYIGEMFSSALDEQVEEFAQSATVSTP